MTTLKRRQELYSQMLGFMNKNKANVVPLDIFALCRRVGIRLVKLSELSWACGISPGEAFSVWGNEDGVICLYEGRHTIVYNDSKPLRRIRFTLCEEIAHMVFGHTADPDFMVFRQHYDQEKYALYDEEARIGAGLLVCHPKLYYAHKRILTPENLSEICNITLPCAKARCEIFDRYELEIRYNQVYQFSTLLQVPLSLLWKYNREAKARRGANAI
jgi:hypothetical protein